MNAARSVVVLLGLALAAGCGSSIPAGKTDPAERHLVYEKATGIWIADEDGANARLLARDGHYPEISPDGRWVAYLGQCSRVTGRCALLLVPTSGGDPRVIDEGDYAQFSWSPDSQRIAVLRVLLPADAALVGLDISNRKAVTLARHDIRGWSFSPDGRRIAFALAGEASKNSETIDLYVADRDGGHVKRITESGDSGFPIWGAKGIAFAKQIPYRRWHRYEVWQVQPDGSGSKSLTGASAEKLLGRGFRDLFPVDWSDDGGTLLAARVDDKGSTPVAVDPETGEARRIGLVESGAKEIATATVAISHDGKSVLAYTHDDTVRATNGTVLTVPYAGGKPTVVARAALNPSWNR